MIARRHHHVSQFYLEGFVGPVQGYRRPMLFVIDGVERRSFPASPRDVAFKKDFHRIDVAGCPPDALEKSFGDFEGKASQALRRIIEARSIQDPNDRAVLFELMTLFAIKTPQHREGVRQFQEQIVTRILSLATATRERWQSEMRRVGMGGEATEKYEAARAFVDAGKYKVTMPTNVHLALELQSVEAVLPFLFRRKWVLLRAPQGETGFITSDDPVCLMWSDPTRRANFKGPGHGVPGTLLIFSLCNELALMGTFEGIEGTRNATGTEIAQINAAIAIHAERQIYGRDDQFSYQMAHNKQVMRGSDFLTDQERFTAEDHDTTLGR
jgi:Protein of unknown function (DUF4238)